MIFIEAVPGIPLVRMGGIRYVPFMEPASPLIIISTAILTDAAS